MDLRVETGSSGIPRVILNGRLDISGVQQIDLKFTAATSAQRKSVIVDLSELEFLSSIGIRMLLTNAKALQGFGSRMVLLNPTEMVATVLKTAGIDLIIPIEKDLTAAENRFL